MPLGIDVAAIAATALVSSLVGAAVSSALGALRETGERASERTDAERASDEAMRVGMRALLWRELRTIHEAGVGRGGLGVAERRHLESVYGAYHALGGNGTGTRLYEDAMSLPVVD